MRKTSAGAFRRRRVRPALARAEQRLVRAGHPVRGGEDRSRAVATVIANIKNLQFLTLA
jgi:hypothetical protein